MTNRRAWALRTGWVIGGLLLIYLLLKFALPPLLRWEGERLATGALGRAVRIGRITFEPATLDLVVRDVQVAGNPAPPSSAASAALPLLGLRLLHVDFSAASIFRAAPIVQALQADGLRVNLTRLAPGHYDIDDLLRRWAPKTDATASQPVHFAVYNVQVSDAALRFDDRPAGRVHDLSSLHLSLPFLSNLPAQVDVKVEPRLSFVLNGAPFDSGGAATPFAKNRAGDLTFKVTDLDLAPYRGYLPDSLPVRLAAGKVSTDIALRFAVPDQGQPALAMRGSVVASDVLTTAPSGAPYLGWKRLALDVREFLPLARRIEVASARIDGMSLTVSRQADGRLDLPGARTSAATSRADALPPAPASTAVASAPTTRSAPPNWQVRLDRLQLADGAVHWHDAAIQPAASLGADAIAVESANIEWPMTRSASVSVRGRLRAPTAGAESGSFSAEGSATNRQATLALSLTGLPIEVLSAYLSQALTPQVSGRLSTQARLDWSTSDGQGDGRLGLVFDQTKVENLRLTERPLASKSGAPTELASLKQLSVEAADLDIAGRRLTVGRVVLEQPSMRLTRAANGQWNAQGWGRPAKSAAPDAGGSPRVAAPAPSASASAAWRILLRDASMTGGQVEFVDARTLVAASAQPVRLSLADLHLGLQNLAWQGDRPTVPAQIELGGRVGSPRAADEPVATGTFDWRGVVGVAPLLMTGSLKLERLPVHLLMPYAPRVPVRVARAELGYVGNLSVKQLPAGWDVDAGADLLLGAVRVEALRNPPDAGSGETLLSWNTLGFKSARLSVKPGAKPQIDVSQAVLADFYSRFGVSEKGTLDFAGFASTPAPPASAASQAGSTTTASQTASSAELPVDIRLGGTTLTQGRIDFSDHFVRPNYSAALTELNGALGALRTDSPALATLTLRGKAAGTALLNITGHVDPMARPVVFDLHAKATDLELAPLSTYAAKYAGYAIERGKLSMDVSYRLGADGRLDATNQVVLNQLTFGAKVDSPVATRLPVRLAVALLKDRRGVIDLDLPISGSLDDPQFSVAGIIGRLLVNLIAKAITSPFSLLTGGAGGRGAGGEPGQIEFVPGTTRLASAGLASLDAVATALVGKPGLLLTVTGAADPVSEGEAYRLAVIDERLQALRKTATVASAAAASAPAPELGSVERTRLLKQLYQETDLPDKPRNLLGIAKDIPIADMQARLEASIDVSDDRMRELALQRGVSVRDALIAKGLSGDRLFLAAPQVGHGDSADATAWVPRASLALTLN